MLAAPQVLYTYRPNPGHAQKNKTLEKTRQTAEVRPRFVPTEAVFPARLAKAQERARYRCAQHTRTQKIRVQYSYVQKAVTDTHEHGLGLYIMFPRPNDV